jgi:3-oxoacyl-(acyl-carrier-protein) synthase
MSRRRVVVSGIGAVTAAGLGVEPLGRALAAGQPLLTDIERFEPAWGEPRRAGQVRDFQARDYMAASLVRQTDVSTHFAFAAVHLGLADARIRLEQVDPLRIGVMVGHAVGGMVYAEPELYNQWVFGPDEVSTYQSIAWFYAAAMGQISIALGLRGYSKAFVADRSSGTHALGHAFRTVQQGHLDLCIAGGTEAPLSPFIYRALASTGHLSRDSYLPFSAAAEGFLVGEGACFLILEELDHALERGAPIYCELTGYAMTTDSSAGPRRISGADDFARAARLALREAGSPAIDAVMADGMASPDGDAAEVQALRALSNGNFESALVTAPKAVVGELYGGGGPVQTAAGALALRCQRVWPLASATAGPVGVPHATEPQARPLQHVLVDSRGLGGVNACLVLRRWEGNGTERRTP